MRVIKSIFLILLAQAVLVLSAPALQIEPGHSFQFQNDILTHNGTNVTRLELKQLVETNPFALSELQNFSGINDLNFLFKDGIAKESFVTREELETSFGFEAGTSIVTFLKGEPTTPKMNCFNNNLEYEPYTLAFRGDIDRYMSDDNPWSPPKIIQTIHSEATPMKHWPDYFPTSFYYFVQNGDYVEVYLKEIKLEVFVKSVQFWDRTKNTKCEITAYAEYMDYRPCKVGVEKITSELNYDELIAKYQEYSCHEDFLINKFSFKPSPTESTVNEDGDHFSNDPLCSNHFFTTFNGRNKDGSNPGRTFFNRYLNAHVMGDLSQLTTDVKKEILSHTQQRLKEIEDEKEETARQNLLIAAALKNGTKLPYDSNKKKFLLAMVGTEIDPSDWEVYENNNQFYLKRISRPDFRSNDSGIYQIKTLGREIDIDLIKTHFSEDDQNDMILFANEIGAWIRTPKVDLQGEQIPYSDLKLVLKTN